MNVLSVENVDKTFTLHLQGGLVLPVLRGVTFAVPPGECVVLGGESGAGKSTIMKMVYGSYAADRGRIALAHRGGELDLVTAAPREVIAARRDSMGYVSQFLRAVPRVSAQDVVAEPLVERGVEREVARDRAAELLARLSIPERLWALPPATFSGGEQQRVNIARGFAAERPLLLLDEPTASLDARNRAVVIEMIRERLAAGTGMLAIFHDHDVRDAVADRVVDVAAFTPAREAVAA
ncbi:phosphonate C-P lyase system protein PhnL [Microbacterium sediminis]|uniref:Phosphonate C-P lyase system protein PhnL n=1 Tax=Microbacterium sediminis TaxID=904291 RepID=A0A1B9N8I3_9MICO|nr:phosphonate C-P lyase system protein PhnL [Microbacterium sediminis]OCG72898.1 phosphonate C-P lyase system protein PhnL [Microbacterium sediminis]QBR75347.1 phosphonate C-P lyase system protein PhnL [Microbacterium sediminis]